jgi:hypothetical protein
MKRSKILSRPLLVPITLIVAAVVSAGVAFATTYFYDFTSGLSPWVGGKDSGVTAYSLSVSPWDNGNCSSPIDRFALLTLEGRNDDVSGIWMQAKFPTTSSSLSSVTVDWEAKDKGSCAGCKVMVYIGGSAPTSTTQFTSKGGATSGWTPYSHSATVFAPGQVYVALGSIDTVGNLPSSLGFDCVKVNVSP